MDFKRIFKKILKNTWLMFALSYGGIFFADEIRELERKIDRDLDI